MKQHEGMKRFKLSTLPFIAVCSNPIELHSQPAELIIICRLRELLEEQLLLFAANQQCQHRYYLHTDRVHQ